MRVRSKINPGLVGTLLEDVWVQWDDHEHPGQRWRISIDQLESEEAKLGLALLKILDNLRDGFSLQIECSMRDIRRVCKMEQDE